jgi:hypothetical protein
LKTSTMMYKTALRISRDGGREHYCLHLAGPDVQDIFTTLPNRGEVIEYAPCMCCCAKCIFRAAGKHTVYSPTVQCSRAGTEMQIDLAPVKHLGRRGVREEEIWFNGTSTQKYIARRGVQIDLAPVQHLGRRGVQIDLAPVQHLM